MKFEYEVGLFTGKYLCGFVLLKQLLLLVRSPFSQRRICQSSRTFRKASFCHYAFKQPN